MFSIAAIASFYRAWRPLCNVIIAALLLAALYGAWDWDRESHAKAVADAREASVRKVYTDAIAKQKADAAALLATETKRANDAERAYNDFIAQQELKDAQATQTAAAQRAALRAAAGPANRLFDPNAQPGRGPGGAGAPAQDTAASSAGADDRPQTGGLLSRQITELLERILAEADDINNAYASCKPYALRMAAGQQPDSQPPPPERDGARPVGGEGATPPPATTTQPE